ncbi:MAG TPA: hypothetical protein PLA68_16185 [Panacibacter sp.]|nr:hypothetical protein [Panacibacter sp.]
MKYFIPAILFTFSASAKAQKIESIAFHLYTDSLKKGVHNYINVDAKLTNGKYLPLSSKEINFWSNTGRWEGNDLIIDSSCKADSVVVKATLTERPELTETITIYMKKKSDAQVLKTIDEILNTKKKN